MTVADLLKIEIEKTQKELDELKLLLPNVSGSALKTCPNCKTKNYHYYAKTNSWCCAFC
tara:strand:- start:305 stop:481 length:177 start_codon:yes stop_codon:yes gene_type:complete